MHNINTNYILLAILIATVLSLIFMTISAFKAPLVKECPDVPGKGSQTFKITLEQSDFNNQEIIPVVKPKRTYKKRTPKVIEPIIKRKYVKKAKTE